MLNESCLEYFDLAEVEGDIGIEVEMEGVNLPASNIRGWRVESDHSLKAREAYEYISATPVSLEGLSPHLEALRASYARLGSTLTESYRAGVHCHVNVQRLTLKQLANYVTLAICFESILLESCGEGRKGNLFCLRVRDAEASVDSWIESFRTGRFSSLNEIKYAFMNVASVPRFGSLEFRGMKSTTEPSILIPWVTDLVRLREVAKEMDNPAQIIEEFSVQGVREFANTVFGRKVVTRKAQEATVRMDMRYAQDFAFSRGWYD